MDCAMVAHQSEPIWTEELGWMLQQSEVVTPSLGLTGCPGWMFTSFHLSDFSFVIFYIFTW